MPAVPTGWRGPVLLSAGLIILYAYTAYPGLAGGDSGQLTVAACSGGVPHPPGYPLWALLGGGLCALPGMDPAFALNLLSLLPTALAAGVLWQVMRELGIGASIAALSAAAFGLHAQIWRYALGAEVFGLHLLLLALLMLYTLRWLRSDDRTALAATALLAGLCLAHHHTAALYIAVWVPWIAAVRYRRGAGFARDMLGCIALGLLGLSAYIYLAMASSSDPNSSWGATNEPSGFITHLLRQEYGTLRLGGSLGPTWELRGLQLGQWLTHQFSAAAPLFGTLGLLGLCWPRGSATALAPLRLALLLYLAVFYSLANLDVRDPLLAEVTARFGLQAQLVLSVLGAYAAHALLQRWPRAAIPAIVLATASLLVHIGVHYPRVDRSTVTLFADYAHEILAPLPSNALLLVRGDLPSGSVRFVQTQNRERPDVQMLDVELLTYPWYVRRVQSAWPEVTLPGAHLGGNGFTLAQLIHANRHRPIAWLGQTRPGTEGFDAIAAARPLGLVRLLHDPATTEIAVHRQRMTQHLPRLDDLPSPSRFAPGDWEQVVLRDLRTAHADAAAWLLTLADASADRQALALMLPLDSEGVLTDAALLKNLGLACARLADDPKCIEIARTAWRRWLEHDDARNDPDRPSIAAWVAWARNRPVSE